MNLCEESRLLWLVSWSDSEAIGALFVRRIYALVSASCSTITASISSDGTKVKSLRYRDTSVSDDLSRNYCGKLGRMPKSQGLDGTYSVEIKRRSHPSIQP